MGEEEKYRQNTVNFRINGQYEDREDKKNKSVISHIVRHTVKVEGL